MTRPRAAFAAALLALVVTGCKPTNDDDPRPVDPPHCFPHCGTRPAPT